MKDNWFIGKHLQGMPSTGTSPESSLLTLVGLWDYRTVGRAGQRRETLGRTVRMQVAIVGAGRVAHEHVQISKAYPGARITAVADVDSARAAAFAARYGIEASFPSATEMLRRTTPAVVHVLTPPASQVSVTREVLEAGCHALVETPLAPTQAEAAALFQIADARGLRLCPVHRHVFAPCMQRAVALIGKGAIGRVTSVEAYRGLNAAAAAFREYPVPNALPWLYELPGGVFQRFLPDELAVLLEHTGPPRTITSMHRSHGRLPQGLSDEIRIEVDGEHATGTVTLACTAGPDRQFLRIHGTTGTIDVDLDAATTRVRPASAVPTRVTEERPQMPQTATGPIARIRHLFANPRPAGAMALTHAFYAAIEHGGPSPVLRERALAVAGAVDAVSTSLPRQALRHEPLRSQRSFSAGATRVLVTGGTGFLGSAVVARLVRDGYAVRVLARKLARVEHSHALGAEVFWGDVADITSFGEAMQGVDVVLHLAAGTSGSEQDSELATRLGTHNLLELCRRTRPHRLIYVSSCSIYGTADCAPHTRITESSPLEARPALRGNYAASKLEADIAVTAFMRAGVVPTTVLRPGTIYGPGTEAYTPLIGLAAGPVRLVIGDGSFVLPFVYVDNLVDAISLSMTKAEAVGEVFNVVDPEPLTKRAFVDGAIRPIEHGARVLYVPYALLYGATWVQERIFSLLKRRPVLTCYRLASSQRSVLYDSRRIEARLGWRALVPAEAAMRRLVEWASAKRSADAARESSPPPWSSPRPASEVTLIRSVV